MNTNKTPLLSAVAGLAMAAIALTGCSYPGSDQDRAADSPTTTSAPETSAPTESTQPTEEAAEETEAPDADKESDDKDETTGPLVSLTPEDEEGVLYLHPVQAFSPLLERWIVDTDGGQLHYTRYTCLGTVDDEGYGSLTSEDGSRWTVTWEGESPMRLSNGQTTSITITDTTLTSHPDVASTHTDLELRKFVGKCTQAGKGVADFVL